VEEEEEEEAEQQQQLGFYCCVFCEAIGFCLCTQERVIRGDFFSQFQNPRRSSGSGLAKITLMIAMEEVHWFPSFVLLTGFGYGILAKLSLVLTRLCFLGAV
jgi:hypothetical protein